jgi:SH3 domain protein
VGTAQLRRIRWYLVCLTLCLLWGVGQGATETMYVTDQLYLSLREGPDEAQPASVHIPSDTKVEVLETENDWAKVALPDGRTGWVMKKYLVSDVPKAIVIEGLKEQIQNQSLTIDELRGQITEMSRLVEELQGQVEKKSLLITDLEGQIREKSSLTGKSSEGADNLALIIEELRRDNASLKNQVSDLEVMRGREAAMRRELEDLQNRARSENPSVGTAVVKDSLAKRKEVYIIAGLAVFAGLAIGCLVRRPNRNRFYLR